MATYRDLTSELANGEVLTRESWVEEQCVFKAEGNLLAPSFYDHYGVGYDRLPLNDVVCFSDGDTVTLGWQPSIEDQEATDWYVEETTTGDEVEVESEEAVTA